MSPRGHLNFATTASENIQLSVYDETRPHHQDRARRPGSFQATGASENSTRYDRTSTRHQFLARFTAAMSRSSLLAKLSNNDPSSYGSLPDPQHDDILNHEPQGGDTADFEATASGFNGPDEARKRSQKLSKSSNLHDDDHDVDGYLDFSSARKNGRRKPSHLGQRTGNKSRPASSETESEGTSEGTGFQSSEDDPPDNSRYPQVRAAVATTDDITASINTPRMWFFCLLCAFCGSATNLFFSLRYPSVAITPVIALVVIHPFGLAWDKLLKFEGDSVLEYINGDRASPLQQAQGSQRYSWRRRLRMWLAQGRWNEKEHACVYISSNVSFAFAFATDIIVEQHKFYKQDVSIVYQLLLTLSTQILGYSFAGITRRFLVRPPSMIWPGILQASAMFTTIHSNENRIANGWRITRWKFFLVVWSAAFAWYFMPGFFMPALSYFNVLTWFAPENKVLSSLVEEPSNFNE